MQELQRQNESQAIKSLAVAFIYGFVGIAILALAIDLMQEEILIKFSKVRSFFSEKSKVDKSQILNQQQIKNSTNNQIAHQNETKKEVVSLNTTDINTNINTKHSVLSNKHKATNLNMRHSSRIVGKNKMPPIDDKNCTDC